MAKALRTVGIVVAVVALAATGVGLAAGGAVAASTVTAAGVAAGTVTASAVTAATALTIAGYATAAGAAISLVSAFAFKPKFNAQGNPTRFATNPQSGIPYAIGRTRMSGVRLHADTRTSPGYTKFDDILGFVAMLSGGGEIDAIEKFTIDNELVSFDGGGQAIGTYANYMAQKVWMGGAQTSALALSLNGAAMPGWTAQHKLSGISHALWMLRFNKQGELFAAGVPEPAWIGRWVKVYDPRLDSTYPGGAGACRALNESTYVWSRNPALHALTWALGRWQNTKKVFGIGAPVENINIGDFVEAANVAEANHWYCGGVEWSTDSKWEIFKRMLQAGGAMPTMNGAMIGCRVFAPKVSVVTINGEELIGTLKFTATKSQRDRINTIIPRYRSETHDWQIVSGTPVTVPAYVTADGRVRQKEYDMPLVQVETGQVNVNGELQAGQLAAYEIVNAREAGPIQFVTGPRHLGLKCGDCVTLHIPEEGFSYVKVLISQPPSFDPSTGQITFVAETETDSKHAFALGKTTVSPDPFTLTPPNIHPATPLIADWTMYADLNPDGLPLLRIEGGTTVDVSWNSVVVQYKKTADSVWIDAGSYDDGPDVKIEIFVEGQSYYVARIAYRGDGGTSNWLTFGEVLTGTAAIANKTAQVLLYQRTATEIAPSVSTAGSTSYTFATGAVSGQPAGWTTAIPSDASGKYLWVISAVAFSTEDIATIPNLSWSTPVVIMKDGTDGAVGVDAVTGYLTNEAFTVFAYANGNVSDYVGASGTFKIFSGVDDVSSYFTLSSFANPQLLAVTYIDQTYTITSGMDNTEDTAALTIRATGSGAYAGVVIDKIFTLAKAKGGYEIVTSLPATNLFNGRIVYYNEKLYRYTTTDGWTVKVDGGDITAGTVTAAKLATTELITLSAQIKDGIINTAKIIDANISTLKVAGNAITANQVITSGDVAVGAGGYSDFLTTGWMTIGDAISGSGIINCTCTIDGTADFDGASLVEMYVDLGAGWVLAQSQIIGVGTNNGNSVWRMVSDLKTVVNGSSVRVMMRCHSGAYIAYSVARPLTVRNIVLTLIGAKR